MRPVFACVVALTAALTLTQTNGASELDPQGPIRIIRSVEPGGQGSRAAARAWRELVQADVGRITEILAGMDGANSVARNWLCSALDQIAERAHTSANEFPIQKLETFLRDRRHDPGARRLAFEYLCEENQATRDRFLPEMLDDPSLELRHEAIGRLLAQAEKLDPAGSKDELVKLYQKAFAAAREKDQIDRSVRKLRSLGVNVDLATHLGLILDWKLIGPFPNAEGKGIDTRAC
jgi:hypothetical protein